MYKSGFAHLPWATRLHPSPPASLPPPKPLLPPPQTPPSQIGSLTEGALEPEVSGVVFVEGSGFVRWRGGGSGGGGGGCLQAVAGGEGARREAGAVTPERVATVDCGGPSSPWYAAWSTVVDPVHHGTLRGAVLQPHTLQLVFYPPVLVDVFSDPQKKK